jgi:hypothetical protein
MPRQKIQRKTKVAAQNKKVDLNDYNPDWFKNARYGTDGTYRKVCAEGHRLTGGKCTLCHRDSKVLHHAQYWSWGQWIADVWGLLRGRKVEAPWYQSNGRGPKRQRLGGLTQGRERHGKTAFVLCSRCHDRVHRTQHWISHSDRSVAVWHNHQRPLMLWHLRLMWKTKSIS